MLELAALCQKCRQFVTKQQHPALSVFGGKFGDLARVSIEIRFILRIPMKYLHTMVRVTDIEQSLRFYRDALGLRELSRKDYTQGRYTLVFLAAPGDEDAQGKLRQTWAPEDYS